MEKKKGNKIINTITLGTAQEKLNQTYGEMASQMKQAYKGIRIDEFGDEIIHKGRNLKDISNYKVNKEYESQNIKQQSGFSAELIEEARQNKEAILSESKVRTRTTDGIGKTNDTQYDHIKIDENGDIITGSGTQMKFLKVSVKNGKAEYDVIDKLANNKEWNRYDTKVSIPKDQYEGAVEYANSRYEENMELYKKALEKGKFDVAQKYKQKAEDYKNAGERIISSKVTEEEAIEARKNPEKFVAKETLSDIHEAGKTAAKAGMLIGGSISIAQNLYAVVKEEKDMGEAIKDIATTTVKSGVISYTVGSSGTYIKSIMHSSESQLIRRLGTTSVPTLIVTGTIEVGKSIKRYACGEIDEKELLEELGEKGVGMITAGYCASSGAVVGATIGSVVPIIGTSIGGVIGGFVGGVLGYNISGVLYKEALGALKAEELSYERRLVIEKLAEQAIEENRRYKEMFIKFSREQLMNREERINNYFSKLNDGILENNIDKCISSINDIGKIFGYDFQFKSMKEFDEFMSDKNSVLEL